MKPDEVIAAIVKILFQAGASRWTVQEKGRLLGAIKVSLQPTEANENVTSTASKDALAVEGVD